MPFDTVFRPGLFEGEVALVTGGGSGIGRCIAHELSALGARVALASRDEAKLAAVAAEIAEEGGEALVHRCDIRREEEVAGLVDAVLERFGRLDHLVNNAGGQFLSAAHDISPNGFRAVVETNLTGTFLVSREAYRRWFKDQGGAIVSIVADMWRGMPMMAHSGAARAGVVNLTQTLALEWAASHVRVNAVAPGYIASSGLTTYPDFVQQSLAAIALETPARRFGTESEVSGAVCFLLSPAARYISGATLRVDHASSLYKPFLPIPEHEGAPAFHGFHLAPELPEALGGGASDG